jgi:hypothetical protein
MGSIIGLYQVRDIFLKHLQWLPRVILRGIPLPAYQILDLSLEGQISMSRARGCKEAIIDDSAKEHGAQM